MFSNLPVNFSLYTLHMPAVKLHSFFNLGTTWRWLVRLTLLQPWPHANGHRYPLRRRMEVWSTCMRTSGDGLGPATCFHHVIASDIRSRESHNCWFFYSLVAIVYWPGHLSPYNGLLRAGRSGDRIPSEERFFRTRPDWPCGQSSLLTQWVPALFRG